MMLARGAAGPFPGGTAGPTWGARWPRPKPQGEAGAPDRLYLDGPQAVPANALAPGHLPSWGTMSVGAELTALSSTLEELTRRVTRILAELSPADEDRYGTDLLEVERTLGAASRRLDRVVAAPRSSPSLGGPRGS